jgi:hypothetical protein
MQPILGPRRALFLPPSLRVAVPAAATFGSDAGPCPLLVPMSGYEQLAVGHHGWVTERDAQCCPP